MNNSLGVCHGQVDIGAEPGSGVASNNDDDIAAETEDTNSSVKGDAECQVGSDPFCSVLNIKSFLLIRTNLERLNTHKSIIFRIWILLSLLTE